MDKTQIDIKENYLYRLDHELLAILLKDRSSGKTLSGQRITMPIKGAVIKGTIVLRSWSRGVYPPRCVSDYSFVIRYPLYVQRTS